MNLQEFIIIKDDSSAPHESNEYSMLINIDHIVSVKPIAMKNAEGIMIQGFWIRMSNNKKYRASKLPVLLLDAFKSHKFQTGKILEDQNFNEVAVH